MLTRFSLMPTEWHSLPHSRRGILEKQYSFLVCLSITSWWCFMHSLPLMDSDPERMAMEEDMAPVGLPKNLTHLSDSLTSSSLRWLGRGLQVLESRHFCGLGTSASLLLLLSPHRPQSLFFNRLEPSSLTLMPSKSTPILEDLRITTLSLDLMILATMWPSLAMMVCLSLIGTSMGLPLTLTMTCSPSGFMVISVLPMKTL